MSNPKVASPHAHRAVYATLLVVALLGCGATPVVAVDIGSAQLAVGDSIRVTAVFGHHHFGMFQDDIHATSQSAPSSFRWTSSDSGVAVVDSRGMVYARKRGTAQISASYHDVHPQHPAVIIVSP